MGRKKKEVQLSMEEIFTDFIDTPSMENAQIREILGEILEANKDNEALMEFFELSKKLEENQAKIDKGKKDLYLPMLEKECDYLEGKAVSVSLKRPYVKKEFDKELFVNDYDEETYNKYMKDKEVKGNCSVKQNDSITLTKITAKEILTSKKDNKKEEA